MEKAQKGNFVCVHYTGTLDNGEQFDSSEGRQPLEIKLGEGQLIDGFEKELEGMAVNETKTFTLDPEDAYGQRDEKLKHSFSRTEIPAQMNPEVGQTVALQADDGRQIPAQIVEVDDQQVTVDLNHPLAGESLTFEIEVVGISDTPQQAPACGPGGDCSSGCSC